MSLIERSLPLIGESGAKKLNNAHIAVFGVGGVGSWCAEALVRSGVGEITVIDGDTVSETNRNRQIIATSSSVGKDKAEVCAERLRDINPDCKVNAHSLFYSAETCDEIELSRFDYIADCIDTVTSKLLLIQTAKACGTPIISSMGTGNRLDPTQITVTDLFATSGDPLARVMRKELKKRGVSELKVVCSAEPPGECFGGRDAETNRATPSSSCFVPATAGLRIAYEITREIIDG
ncbi:MAG: tRNA threonylcarbamoyladenosine dehydratase [Clostridia bacterium]|nr:tRNA threonylcarbamoyladenosine dehydratase [Clostridia bacterium]